ncbi:MAG TPA: polyprenol monophosphomannose synthase [Pyrinomonadaceae bacterium]|nr:polyprenol monophosphomannose synthase [Pyrinomonadaceae bacterium]
MRAVVVIPTYNELANLKTLVQKLHEYAPALHILIVDDNSPDGTGQLADELCNAEPDRISVLHRQRKEGLGKAYVDGFKEVLKKDYEYVLHMDADLSHDPLYLPDFFAKIESHDLVVGSRYLKGISVANWDFKRLIMSKLATNYVRFITRMPFTDTTSGFGCWRREALQAISFENAFSSGYVFLVELKYKAYRKGFRVSEVPIIFIERKMGNSKMDWAVIWEAFWGVIRIRLRY